MARLANVVCVGDSLTEGGYPTILQDLLNSHETSCSWRVEKWAVIGSTTKDWLQNHLAGNAMSRFAQKRVDVFVLMLGTNDCQRQIQMSQPFRDSEFQQRLMQIAKILMNQGAPVILMTPPSVDAGGTFGQYIDAGLVGNNLPRTYQQAAAALNCPLADAFSATGGARPNRQAFVDGCHLSPEGNRLVANAVMQTVIRAVMSAGSNSEYPTNTVAPQAAPGVSPSATAAVNTLTSPTLVQQRANMPQQPSSVQQPSTVVVNMPQQPSAVQQPSTVVAKMPRSAAMPLRPDGYVVGAAVEVWSQSWDSWFTGRITKLDGSSVLAEFVAPDGKEKEKWMPIGHKDLRPASRVSVQASPGLNASAVNLMNVSPMQTSRMTNTTLKTQTTTTQTPSVPPMTSPSAFNGSASVALGSSRGSMRWTAGEKVEYRSRRDQQWYRGTVQNVDASGCLLMLEVGILKSVPMQDAPNRLRSVTSFSSGSTKAVNSYYSGSAIPTRESWKI